MQLQRRIALLTAAFMACLMPSAGRAEDRTPPTRDIETTFIWTQSEAEVKCPAAAAEANGRWTGKWRMSVPGQTTFCEIVELPARAAPPPPRAPARFTRQLEVGPIWNQADAETKCRRAADASNGRWTGQWRTTTPGVMSVCDIAYEPTRRVRDVEAGPIWSEADAAVKCPVAAYAVRGVWTGQWRTVVPAEMSVCLIADPD